MEKNIRQLDEIIWQLDLKVNNDKEFIAPYLIKADEGYIIVDVGPTCGIPELERQLKVLGVNKNNLKYVSPKSCKAVSKSSGEKYKEKLLLLPQFFIDKVSHCNLATS